LLRNGGYGATTGGNGNGTMERHNGMAERNGETAMAERQQNGGNQALYTDAFETEYQILIHE